MKNWVIFLPLFLLMPAGLGYALDVNGLNEPESVIRDSKTGNYYISNLNGAPLEKDNNGYISKVDAQGLVVVLKFIQPVEGQSELHAPKGMAIWEDTLYVSDVDVVRAYDLETGEALRVIPLEPYVPEFLNDVTVDSEGNLYVSDMEANQIFKIDTQHKDQVKIFRSGDALGGPNGLFYNHHNRRLLVAAWDSGEILEVDQKGQIEVLKDGLSNLDGIFIDGQGNVFVSSYTEGEIYKISESGRGRLSLFQTGLQTPADIAYDESTRHVLVPLMMDNRVSSFDISGLEKSK